MPTVETMYNNIEAERARNGWTIQEFADRLGICEKTYRDWISKDKELKTSTLAKMAELFECSTDYLLGLSDCMRAPTSRNTLQQ